MRPRHLPGDTVLQRLPQMVIFDALVREQGISAAARRLGVSKSHISKQLALLETALGAQLVQRTTRRFGLTELGQSMPATAALWWRWRWRRNPWWRSAVAR